MSANASSGIIIDSEHKQMMCVWGILVLLISLYWVHLKLKGGKYQTSLTDGFNRTLFYTPWGNSVSWWPVSHFFLNMLLGFLYPKKGVFIIGAGILWELIEVMLGLLAKHLDAKGNKFKEKLGPTSQHLYTEGIRLAKLNNLKNKRSRNDTKAAKDPNSVQYKDSWWAGSFDDVIFNVAGFYTGKFLREGCMRGRAKRNLDSLEPPTTKFI